MPQESLIQPEETEQNDPKPAEGEGEGDKTPQEGDKVPEGDTPTKPEGLPDKFWDAEKGQVRQDALLESYTNMEKEYSKLKQPAPVPEEYELNVPEDFKDVDLTDDPMVEQYKQKAKENGWTQEQFEQGLSMFLGVFQDQYLADTEKEIEALGGPEKVKQMTGPIDTWAKANLSKEAYDTLVATSTTANTVKLFDEIRKLASVQPPPPDGASGQTPSLTEDDLHAMMKKPEYYDPSRRDPKVIKQVEEGFKTLYVSKKG